MVAIHGLIRDERLGVFVLGNLDHAEVRHALMYTVFDRFGGRTDRDWNADLIKLYGDLEKRQDELRKRAEAQRVPGTSPSLPLERYAGTYSDPLYGSIEVKLDQGALRFTYGSGAGKLTHWHFNTFRAAWTEEWRQPGLVTFILDAQGEPTTLEQGGARFARKPRP
jgi:hypothetical protein